MKYKHILIILMTAIITCNLTKVFCQDSLYILENNKDYVNKILEVKFTIKAKTKTFILPDSTQINIGYKDDLSCDVFLKLSKY